MMSYATASGTIFTVTWAFSGTAAAVHAANATVRFPLVSTHVNGPRGAVLELEKKHEPRASNAADAAAGHVMTMKADGTSGWQAAAGGGAPSGPNGGDPSASYPNTRVTRIGGVDQTAVWTPYTPTVTPGIKSNCSENLALK